jgi:DNA-binding MarR family transcriptional regulator
MAKYGLGSTGYGFLLSLQNQGGLIQRELCSGLSIDNGLGSRTLVSLEKHGYIVRERLKDDKRFYAVYLTDKARAIVPELHKSYEEWWEQLCGKMSKKDITILASWLKAMAEQASGKEVFPDLWKELS